MTHPDTPTEVVPEMTERHAKEAESVSRQAWDILNALNDVDGAELTDAEHATLMDDVGKLVRSLASKRGVYVPTETHVAMKRSELRAMRLIFVRNMNFQVAGVIGRMLGDFMCGTCNGGGKVMGEGGMWSQCNHCQGEGWLTPTKEQV